MTNQPLAALDRITLLCSPVDADSIHHFGLLPVPLVGLVVEVHHLGRLYRPDARSHDRVAAAGADLLLKVWSISIKYCSGHEQF